MKIAVTSTGPALDDSVEARFGRCPYFLIIDTDTMQLETIENTNAAAAGGAGINSAKTVIDAGAKAVITGNCGPNAERTLTAAGIQLYLRATGKVTEVIELFKSGKLPKARGPNVQSHFGTGN